MNTTCFYKLLTIPCATDERPFADLQALAARYPWFALAHQLVYETALRNNHPAAAESAGAAAVYATGRSRFYWRLQRPTVGKVQDEQTPRETPALPKKPVVMAGGDYFASADFEELSITDNDPLSHFIITQPKLNPNMAVLNAIPFSDAQEKRVAPLDFVTETLAQIYANQQLYSMAADTYKKLILQIPEKSAYFATQIKELKKLK